MFKKALTTCALALSLGALGTVPVHAVEIDLTEDVWALEAILSTQDVLVEDGGVNLDVPSADGDIIHDETPSGPVKGTDSSFGTS